MIKLLLPLVLLFTSLTCFGLVPELVQVRQAAERGEADAQDLLGRMYYRGEVVPKDDKEAFKWIRKAAEQGEVFSQHSVGRMYDYGEGVPEDDTEAVKWYRKAAEQGLATAQYQLGLMYIKGEGVPEDFVFAYMWLNLAATPDVLVPDFDLKMKAKKWKDFYLSKDMTYEQIAEAQKLSREWMAKHSEKNK